MKKSPIKKGIGTYSKQEKGERGFKMPGSVMDEYKTKHAQSEVMGRTTSDSPINFIQMPENTGDNEGVLSAMGSGAGKGASMGATIGPWGAVAGALVGGIVGGGAQQFKNKREAKVADQAFRRGNLGKSGIRRVISAKINNRLDQDIEQEVGGKVEEVVNQKSNEGLST